MTHLLNQDANSVQGCHLKKLLERYLHDRNNDPFMNPLDKRDENHIRRVFALLGKCYPDADTSHIDGGTLKKFQEFLVKQIGRNGQPFSRSYCNDLVGYLKTVFYWASRQKTPIISEARAFALSKVPELKKCPKIRENKKRLNAPVEHFEALYPLLRPVCADMLRLQFMHAMRTGEVCTIRPCFIDFDWDRKNGLWQYQPDTHKTAHSTDAPRSFALCRKSQEILKKYLPDNLDSDEPIFRNMRGRPFTVWVYDNVIRKAIEKHGLKKIVPYQTRHTTATQVAQDFGIKHAQALLGHTTEQMTGRYVHDSDEKIRELAVARNHKVEQWSPDSDPPTSFAVEIPENRPKLRIVRGA